MNFGRKGTIEKQRKIKSSSKKVMTKISITFFRTFLIAIIVIAIVSVFAGFGILKGVIDKAPSIDYIKVVPDSFFTTIYDRKGKQITKLVGSNANRDYRSLEDIPEIVQEAFIAIEDARFYSHNGIDIRGIFRAFFNGIVNGGKFEEGASTITQQLLKNQVFNGGSEVKFMEKLERKLQEQYLAIQLEDKYSKDEILEYYLNAINLGQNTLGVQAAAARYFNKNVSELDLSEAAVIASITQNPSLYNPIKHPDKNAEKRAIVLDYMEQQGYITKKEHKEALEDDVYSRIQFVNDTKFSEAATINSYFVDELIEQVQYDLQDKLGYTSTAATNMIYRGGLSIYTTLDSSIQKICDDVLQDESLYPSNSEWELSYQLSVTNKKGKETHYSAQSLVNYFRNTKHLQSFDLYFSKKEDAMPYVKEFYNYVVKKSDKVTGEVIDFTIQPQISFVLIDQYTGAVKAIVGGRGEKKANLTLNRATRTVRQPGSTFKILSTYLPALDTAGMTLATVQDDAPYTYPNGTELSNWGNSNYKGLTTLRQGIVNSMNIVTVKTLADPNVTPKTGYDYLLKLGFTTIVDQYVRDDGKIFSDIDLPLALGGLTRGVTNLELTAAFGAVANGGIYNKPIFYTKIVDHNGKVLINNKPEKKQVMKESTAWLLTSAMEDVISMGTGTPAKFSNIKMAAAGKTGTTSSDYDLWFCGYTPYYTASIWSGYDNNKDQDNTSYHKILWKTIMEKLHAKKKYRTFQKPSSITTAYVCTKCGKLAIDGVCNNASGGPAARTEYFASGTVPTEKCDCHVSLKICTASNKLASDYCPSSSIIYKVFLIKEETDTTADTPYIMPKGLEDSICTVHSGIVVPKETENQIPTDNPEDEPEISIKNTPKPEEPIKGQPTSTPEIPDIPAPTPTPLPPAETMEAPEKDSQLP